MRPHRRGPPPCTPPMRSCARPWRCSAKMLRWWICCGDSVSLCFAKECSESAQHIPVHLQRFQKGDQAFVLLPWPPRLRCGGVAQRHRLGFRVEVDFGVDVGRIETDVTEPRTDRVEIDASPHQGTCRRVSHDVGSDFSSGQCRHPKRASLDKTIDSEPGKGLPDYHSSQA